MSSSLQRVINQAGRVILGKERQIRMALACLLARGHLLIEDLPGVGKTTLAHVLARSLGLGFHRIQFTSDMLPADILGVSIYDRDSSAFKFHPGPIFSQLILADEVNRATPKTQSALLEAMEEHQVTAEGETRRLPEPFFVVATQNPSHQVGTFPLPESQLDRFLMRIELGYPDREAERALLQGAERRDMIATLEPCLNPGELVELQAAGQARARLAGALRLHPGAHRAHAALARVTSTACRRAPRSRSRLRARLGADRGPRQGRARGRAGGAARRRAPPPAPGDDGVRRTSFDKPCGLIEAVPIPVSGTRDRR